MTSLFLAILSSASLALIFRTTEARNHSRYVITMVNYLAAVATALFLSFIGSRSNASVTAEPIAPVVPPPSGVSVVEGVSVFAGVPTALLGIAIPGGILFFVSFILYQRSVADHGPGPAGMYGKLGILVPMVLSMIVWNELPSALQWVGLVLALTAIVVSQGGVRRLVGGAGTASAANRLARPILLILLLSMGFAEFSNKLFERFVDDRFRSLFLGVLFGTAFVCSLVAVVYRGEKPKGSEFIWGLLVGVPNLFSSFFLIAALRTVPAAVAFPVFSAGSIGVIVLGARILYRDSLTQRQWISVALTACALVLINV
jgi:drug/metabolite transporter (DMT)-like permease